MESTCRMCGRVFRPRNPGGTLCSAACRDDSNRPTAEGRIAAFMARIDRRGPDECWPYMGARDKHGYGRIPKRAHGHHLAHRRALELSGVAVPSNRSVLHSCDNPPCCNPRHLRVGTTADNIRDSVQRGRRPKGETHPSAVLSDEKVRAIRRRYAAGERVGALAAAFPVGSSTISNIVRRRLWRHLPDEVETVNPQTNTIGG